MVARGQREGRDPPASTQAFTDFHLDGRRPLVPVTPRVEPAQELRAALAIIRLAVASVVPATVLPPRDNLSVSQEAEALANAIHHLAEERDRLAILNPA